MTGEGQRQTYLEETYETVLSPRTVLVETTDCDDYGWNGPPSHPENRVGRITNYHHAKVSNVYLRTAWLAM